MVNNFGAPLNRSQASKSLLNTPSKEVSDFHNNSDVDSSAKAQHHTLGVGPTQAAPGNHDHDDIYSKLGHSHLPIIKAGFGVGNVGADRRLAFSWPTPFPTACRSLHVIQAGTYAAPYGTVNFMVESVTAAGATIMCEVDSLVDMPFYYIAVGD